MDDTLKISIASGKGGTGKTTVAVNLAYELARRGYSVTYADSDVEEPNGHLFLKPRWTENLRVAVKNPWVDHDRCTFCGLCSEECRFNALAVTADKVLVFPSLCHGCGACYYICPEDAITEVDRFIGQINIGRTEKLDVCEGRLDVGEAMAPPVTRELKRVMPVSEISIIDSPPGSSCPVIEAIKETDFVVLVTEPTPFGLNDLRIAVDMVRTLGLEFGVVINRSDIGDDRVEKYCREEKVDILENIPFDRVIAVASSRGEMIVPQVKGFGDRLMNIYERICRRTGNDGTGHHKR